MRNGTNFNFRNLNNPHAYLQITIETPIGVALTRPVPNPYTPLHNVLEFGKQSANNAIKSKSK